MAAASTAAAAAAATQEIAVEELEPEMEMMSFAVRLPPSIVQNLDEPDFVSVRQQELLNVLANNKGIVGTITFLGPQSVMIWFGWGQIIDVVGDNNDNNNQLENLTSSTTSSGFRSLGNSTGCAMGPLVVAMPRTQYKGAFADNPMEGASSKLIGDADTERELMARQMAARLSQRLKISVFVSCSFDVAPPMANEGVDEAMIHSRAAALAEREVYRILEEKSRKQKS